MGLYVYIHKYEFLLFLILFILVCLFFSEMSRLIMSRISGKGHNDMSRSADSIDATTDLIESDTNDAR